MSKVSLKPLEQVFPLWVLLALTDRPGERSQMKLIDFTGERWNSSSWSTQVGGSTQISREGGGHLSGFRSWWIKHEHTFLELLTRAAVGSPPFPQDCDLGYINTVAIVIIQEVLLFDLKKNSTSEQGNTDSRDHNRPSEGKTCQIPSSF